MTEIYKLPIYSDICYKLNKQKKFGITIRQRTAVTNYCKRNFLLAGSVCAKSTSARVKKLKIVSPRQELLATSFLPLWWIFSHAKLINMFLWLLKTDYTWDRRGLWVAFLKKRKIWRPIVSCMKRVSAEDRFLLYDKIRWRVQQMAAFFVGWFHLFVIFLRYAVEDDFLYIEQLVIRAAVVTAFEIASNHKTSRSIQWKMEIQSLNVASSARVLKAWLASQNEASIWRLFMVICRYKYMSVQSNQIRNSVVLHQDQNKGTLPILRSAESLSHNDG